MIVFICPYEEAIRRASTLPTGVAAELALDWVTTVPAGFYGTTRKAIHLVEDDRIRIFVNGYSIPSFVIDCIGGGDP